MSNGIETLADWRTDIAKIRSSYRRLAVSRLPVNLYSAQAQAQRRAAALLHGTDERASLWEKLDGRQLADDLRGDRTSLLLGGATGGVALSSQAGRGLLAAAGTGTLFITHPEKLSTAAQHVLCRILEAGRYTPVGDPYPRPISCRIIVATQRPLLEMARQFLLSESLADVLGRISLSAEKVIAALEVEHILKAHPGNLAAAS